MTPEAESIAVAHGATADDVRRHAAKMLTEADLGAADLVLAMTRDHRREIAELNPAAVRRTFTLRELSRLLEDLTDAELLGVAAHASRHAEAGERMADMLVSISGRRGASVQRFDPSADDVVDPYRRSAATYERSARELTSAIPATERLIRLALR